MSKVHYYRRYSQPENVATNNTLLLLSRLYAHDSYYLEASCGGDRGDAEGQDVRLLIKDLRHGQELGGLSVEKPLLGDVRG